MRIGHVLVTSAFVIASCATRPNATAPATSALPDDAIPAHELLVLESAVLDESRRVYVYTPPEHTSVAGSRFPILYMPDGGLEEDFPHVARAVDAAIRAREMEPVILVGIENTERRRDLTGPTTVAADREIAPRVGGSTAFRQFLRDELFPLVEARVRGNGSRGIIGESLAGAFIVETLAREPDLFAVYIALSPSLWWNAGELVRTAPEWVATLPRREGRIYLATAADDDLDGAAVRLGAAFAEHAPITWTWTYAPRPGETHRTIYRATAPSALRWAFPYVEGN